ncbi:hypothetical protein, partial [Planktothrix sp.]|uniref:hypothetical protein n=1 Tax=Planktothrix sp. TaxID=3088171 RepID=UPI0038D3CA09
TKHSQYRIKFMPTKSDIYKLVEMIDSLWEECDKLKKSSKQYQLNRKKIERLKRMIKPVGIVKKPLKSESGYLICQFRYSIDGIKYSKNFKPVLYDVVNHAVKSGDNINEIIRLIEHKGDRKKSLGNDYEWIVQFEMELEL